MARLEVKRSLTRQLSIVVGRTALFASCLVGCRGIVAKVKRKWFSVMSLNGIESKVRPSDLYGNCWANSFN